MTDQTLPREASPTMAASTTSNRTHIRRAATWGVGAAALVVLGIVLGSRRFRDFDPALVPYAGASVFAAFGLGYRYGMWLERPPTRLYWRRGWQIFLRRMPGSAFRLFGQLLDNIVVQRFIEHRSRLRWLAHLGIAWGCILAAAVTFPLSFGWIRFETLPGDASVYQAFVFGVRVLEFPLHSLVAPWVFHVLDVAAFLVLFGIALALFRRARDRGALAVQGLAPDLVPLLLLAAVSVTGLMLTFSTHWMAGQAYGFLSELHAVTVIATLVYLPFGKFFHIFQRPAQLSIHYYRDEGRALGEASCVRCGAAFTSALHVADLKTVQSELGIRFAHAGAHYQDVCPACRRKMLAIAQDSLWRAERSGAAKG